MTKTKNEIRPNNALSFYSEAYINCTLFAFFPFAIGVNTLFILANKQELTESQFVMMTIILAVVVAPLSVVSFSLAMLVALPLAIVEPCFAADDELSTTPNFKEL